MPTVPPVTGHHATLTTARLDTLLAGTPSTLCLQAIQALEHVRRNPDRFLLDLTGHGIIFQPDDGTGLLRVNLPGAVLALIGAPMNSRLTIRRLLILSLENPLLPRLFALYWLQRGDLFRYTVMLGAGLAWPKGLQRHHTFLADTPTPAELKSLCRFAGQAFARHGI